MQSIEKIVYLCNDLRKSFMGAAIFLEIETEKMRCIEPVETNFQYPTITARAIYR
jgi:hypothetical protein